MRVFLAVEFSDDIKDYLVGIQEIVKEHSLAGNFTLKENFHLTLRFIGEIQIQELNQLKKAINQAAQNEQPFELSFKKLGQFPRGNKRIIWIGLEQSEMLQQLYSSLEKSLEEQGYPREQKDFVPHITIGRQVILTEEFNQLVQRISIDKVKIPIKRISLMESTRIKGRLTYVSLYSQKLITNV